jgi:hypothetical protein
MEGTSMKGKCKCCTEKKFGCKGKGKCPENVFGPIVPISKMNVTKRKNIRRGGQDAS